MPDQRSSAPKTRAAPTGNDSGTTRSEAPAPGAPEARDRPREYGGRKGPDPVRYGDWEKNGRCIDF